MGKTELARRLMPFLLVSCLVRVSVAEPSNDSRVTADALFEQGKAALRDGDWVAACDRFRKSQALDPSPSTLVKIARCEEQSGHFRLALALYERALSLLERRSGDDAHTRDLRAMIHSSKQDAASKLGTLRLNVHPQPPQLQLEIDGERIDQKSWSSVWLEPGTHQICAKAQDYQAEVMTFAISSGELRELSIELKAAPETRLGTAIAPARGRVQAKPQEPTQTTDGWGGGRTILILSSASVGAALMGISGYYAQSTHRLVHDARDKEYCNSSYECDPRGMHLLDEATRQQRMAIVFGSTGVLLAGLAGTLWAIAPSKSDRTVARSRLVLELGGSQLNVRGQW